LVEERQMYFLPKALERSVRGPVPLARAALLRHVALIAAMLVAFLRREQLGVGRAVLWALGAAILLNVAALLVAMRVRARALRWFALSLGLCTWNVLIAQTGGSHSPFCVGLALEVLFAAVLFSPADIVLVTGVGIMALAAQQLLAPLAGGPLELWIQVGFLALVGALAASLSFHAAQTEQRLQHTSRELLARITSLNHEVHESRVLGIIGENAARQAHQFKSTLSALRGTLQLMEQTRGEDPQQQRSLDLARHTTDQLEQMVRGVLKPAVSPSTNTLEDNWTPFPELCRIVEQVRTEVALAHPEVHWNQSHERGTEQELAVAAVAFREVAWVLLENAAEAVGSSGVVALRWALEPGTLTFRVEDNGRGLEPHELEQLFRRGVSSKPNGNGVGLWLSRRLVEARGGRLTAEVMPIRGMRFALTLTRREIERN
jgi:signal transduction histidine kinase